MLMHHSKFNSVRVNVKALRVNSHEKSPGKPGLDSWRWGELNPLRHPAATVIHSKTAGFRQFSILLITLIHVCVLTA
jgi:hypothetical protein